MAGISGDAILVAPGVVNQVFAAQMAGAVMVRVWNMSRSPVAPAWITGRGADRLIVRDADEIAGWQAGDTLQLGDPNPTGNNAKGMVAIDISPYLAANFGTVFPQAGVSLYLLETAQTGTTQLDVSGSGAGGTLLRTYSSGTGTGGTLTVPIPTATPSPVSNSNLVFASTQVSGTNARSALSAVRILGIYL